MPQHARWAGRRRTLNPNAVATTRQGLCSIIDREDLPVLCLMPRSKSLVLACSSVTVFFSDHIPYFLSLALKLTDYFRSPFPSSPNTSEVVHQWVGNDRSVYGVYRNRYQRPFQLVAERGTDKWNTRGLQPPQSGRLKGMGRCNLPSPEHSKFSNRPVRLAFG